MSNEIHVDSARVDEVIRKMTQMTNDMRDKEKQMKSYLSTTVPQFWRDAHYKALMDIYTDFSNKLQRTLVDADQVIIPHLKNVKKAIEEYNRISRR
jgi:hypothetical protein